MTPRTGTHYLAHLLRLHPDCKGSYRIPDDFFIFKAHKLCEFARSCAVLWADWKVGPESEEQLLRCLGQGLTDFLAQQTGALRPVTKTPSVKNLPLVFRLVPEACLIVLLRDPHAVVTSMVRGFGNSYAEGLRTWAAAADEIMAFQDLASKEGHRYLLVRYEVLLSDFPGELRRILEFAGLDSNSYDFEAAANAPVIGSSMLLDKEGNVTWSPVPKPAGFSPLQRSTTWSKAREARLAWLAGRQGMALGYPVHQLGWGVWPAYNIFCDGIDVLSRCWRHLQNHSNRVAGRKRRSAVEGKSG